jgi:hypothetical protein
MKLRHLPSLFLAALLFFSGPAPVSAASPDAVPAGPNPPANAVSPQQLSQSIDQVLQKREFAWRMPREKPVETDAPKSWLARAFLAFVDLMRDAVKAAAHSLVQALRWIGRMLLKMWPEPPSSQPGLSRWGSSFIYSLQILLLILLAALAGVLAVLILRACRRRRPGVLLAEPVAALPDLTDNNVAADQLPEDGWLKMAREMMEQGNLLLALRAFYLASLAHLAAREMISIAIFKSNREYEAELRRRARALPEVQNAFSQNVAVFDRAWYGLHDVSRDALQEFQTNLARIRAC